VVGELLYRALQPEPALNRLSQRLHNQRSQLPVSVPWYTQMADHPSNYMDHFFAVLVFPAALQEANAIQQRNEAAAAARRSREQQWEQMEEERLAGSGAAQALAFRYLVPAIAAIALLLVVATLLMLEISRSSSTASSSGTTSSSESAGMVGLIILNIAVGGATAIYLVVSEISLAQRLGSDYRGLTRFSRSGRSLQSFGSGMTTGRGCLILVIGLLLLSSLIVLPLIACVVAAVLQLLSVNRRRREWEGWHERARQQVLGGGR
jgi:hypothetical protein